MDETVDPKYQNLWKKVKKINQDGFEKMPSATKSASEAGAALRNVIIAAKRDKEIIRKGYKKNDHRNR